MRLCAVVLLLVLSPLPSLGQTRDLALSLVHLRSGAEREWTSFEPEADGPDTPRPPRRGGHLRVVK